MKHCAILWKTLRQTTLSPMYCTYRQIIKINFESQSHMPFFIRLLKTCSSTTHQRKLFIKATIIGHFGFEFELNLIIIIINSSFIFWKALFARCSLLTLKCKASIFKFLQFEEQFHTTLFSWWISTDWELNWRNKAPFSNSSSVVWTANHTILHYNSVNGN